MPRNVWNEELDRALLNEIATGRAYPAIAARLSERFGIEITRNAVIGRGHRLGVKIDAKERQKRSNAALGRGNPKVKAEPSFTPKPKVTAPVAIVSEVPGTKERPSRLVMLAGGETIEIFPKMCTLLELPHNGCKWPYGDGPFRFCGCTRVLVGGEVSDGLPYCDPHERLAHETRAARKPGWG